MSISVEELQLGIPLSVELLPGQERLYRIEVPADQTLRFRVGSDDDKSINEVFLRHDAVPTSAAFDATYTGPLSAGADRDRPRHRAGRLLRAGARLQRPGRTAAPSRCSPTSCRWSSPTSTPTSAATAGSSPPRSRARSSTRTRSSSCRGRASPSSSRWPGKWSIRPRIIAKFDFTDAPHGLYDLKVINPDGSETIEPYRFLIERGIEPEVTIGIGGPRVILAGDQATYSVALQNLSNLDAPYTFFQVGVPRDEQQPVRLRPAVPRLLHQRARHARRRRRQRQRGGAVDQHGVDHQHQRPAADLGLPLRPPGRRFRRLQLQRASPTPASRRWHDRAFDAFRTQMAGAFPEHDELLADGRRQSRRVVGGGQGKVDETLPGAKARARPARFRRPLQAERRRPGRARDPVHSVPLPRRRPRRRR